MFKMEYFISFSDIDLKIFLMLMLKMEYFLSFPYIHVYGTINQVLTTKNRFIFTIWCKIQAYGNSPDLYCITHLEHNILETLPWNLDQFSLRVSGGKNQIICRIWADDLLSHTNEINCMLPSFGLPNLLSIIYHVCFELC